MSKSKKIKYFEIVIYIIISFLAIAIPLFIRFEDGIEWNFIFREWIKLIPFFLIFLINNFILAPKLLFRNQITAYLISCFLLLFFVAFLNNIFIKPHFHQPKTPNKEEIYQNNRTKEREYMPHLHFENNKFSKHNKPLPPGKIFFNFGIFIIGFLIIGFNSGVKIFVHWISEQEERNEKEKQYLTTELAFLRHQISPHFFMNTLNNIHALVDIDSEASKDAIIKLSRLMRYLLYETDTDKVPLNKEIEFIESYVELMRLRYDDNKLSVEISYFGLMDNINIPSLLFLPLVENAFKHGIINDKKSFINIQFNVNDDNLIFTIKNSKFLKKNTGFSETSGIGLDNIRKRLNLIYKNNYIFLIDPKEDVFEVSLAIPLEQNTINDTKMHDFGG